MSNEQMVIGGRYNWRSQPERLIYLGKKGLWHQFEKIDAPGVVWCEVLDEDLHMLERTELNKPVAYVDDKGGLTPTMHGLFAMKPGDQLYQGSAIKAKLDEAAALVERQLGGYAGKALADDIRSLGEAK